MTKNSGPNYCKISCQQFFLIVLTRNETTATHHQDYVEYSRVPPFLQERVVGFNEISDNRYPCRREPQTDTATQRIRSNTLATRVACKAHRKVLVVLSDTKSEHRQMLRVRLLCQGRCGEPHTRQHSPPQQSMHTPTGVIPKSRHRPYWTLA